MTLILTCLTGTDIVQVSDTRLTWPDGRVFDDYAAKTTLVSGRHLLGYTGIACLQSDRTDFVLGFAASRGNSVDESMVAILETITARCRVVPPTIRHLQVLSAGWARTDPQGPRRPLFIRLSNLTDERWDLPAMDTFDEQGSFLPEGSVVVHVAGQPVPEFEILWLRRTIRRELERGIGAKTIAVLLAGVARRLAGRNKKVGSNLLISSLPRDAVPAEDVFTFGSPNWSKPVFLYLTSEKATGTFYPNVAFEGMSFNAGRILWPGHSVASMAECS